MTSRTHRAIAPLLATLALASAFSPARAQATDTLLPPPVHWESAAFDAARGRLVLFGGAAIAGAYLSETWQWDGTRWTTLADSASSPGPRHAHAMGYDRARSRVVLFGGMVESQDKSIPIAQRERRLCDTWSLEGARWTRIDRGDSSPCAIEGIDAASLLSRGTRGGLLLVEGPREAADDGTLARIRLWRWTDTSWALLDDRGPRRWPEANGGVAFDERRAVLVVPVLGGPDAGVWEWDGTRWRHLRVPGPPPRRNFGIAYDSRRGRVVLLGGLTADPRRWLGDHWTWDGARWTEIPSAQMQPSPRSHATLLDDRRAGRLLYFGGASDRGAIHRELWIFDRDGWRLWRPTAR